MSNQSPLLFSTPPTWVDAVLADFDLFLLDHASCEKKASGMALSMLSHYPDKTKLVSQMTDLAIEELAHYREVVKIIHARGLITSDDSKDPYVNEFRKVLRKGQQTYLLDRLLTASIIEARGAERFGIIAEALDDPQLKPFYEKIATSEERHYLLFLDLAKEYIDTEVIQERWKELLTIEAEIVAALPSRPALH